MVLTTYSSVSAFIMNWTVILHELFENEIEAFPRSAQTMLAARVRLLALYGPSLGRPHVDTLKASKHVNMKELRFDADDGAWRVAFAFDPERKAVLLLGGDKSGINEKRFYNSLIASADLRFDQHLAILKVKK
jgi:hypothetical protein